MSGLLVVDTSVAAHLLRATPLAGQEHPFHGARVLGTLERQGWVLAMATPAYAEVLAGIPQAGQTAARRLLQQRFQILNFDTEAAERAALIAARGIKGPRRGTRQSLKVDAEILGCAARWGAAGTATSTATPRSSSRTRSSACATGRLTASFRRNVAYR